MNSTASSEPRSRTPDLASLLMANLPDRDGFGDASLITLTEDSVDLGGGNPDPALLPTALYAQAAAEMTADPGFADSLKYPPAAGTPELRSLLARRSGVEDDQVIVTSGGIHGLALATLGVINPGDVVLVDNPVFPLFLRVLDLVGAQVVPVTVGPDGIDVDQVEQLLQQGVRPAALFTVPTFQNPTGAVLSPEKATRLLELADRYGFIVFADDPYRDLAFPGVDTPASRALQGHPNVVGVQTFAKTLGPAIRLGWITVPRHLSPGFVKLRNRLDGQASGVLQDLALRIVTHRDHDRSIADAGAGYAAKEAALRSALLEGFGDAIDISPAQGGFFLWANIRTGPRGEPLDSQSLFDRAQAGGVTYQRGEWFGVPMGDASSSDRVRLSFSEPSESELGTGAARLAAAWRSLA